MSIDPKAWIDHLQAHLPVARAGREPEGVHQVRVATRRLQSFLRLSGLRVLLDDLRWVRGAMGAVRDLDVLLGTRPPAPFAAFLRAERRVATLRVRKLVADKRTSALLDALRTLPLLDENDGHRRLQRDVQRVLADGDHFEHCPLDAESLHTLRRHAKALRYGLDWLSLQRSGLKPLQEALGESNDAYVALSLLRRWPDHPSLPDYEASLRARLEGSRVVALQSWRVARLDLLL